MTISGNEVNGAGGLILGPPADKSVWTAEDVQFGSNARFDPLVSLLVLPLNSLSESTAKELRAREVGCTSCDALGYASFESPDILHRNFGWGVDQGRPFGHNSCENSQALDGRLTCVWNAQEGDLDLSLAGASGAGVVLDQVPTLAGMAVYAAIRVKPLQNATELELVLGDARARCGTVAYVWTRCVVATVLEESGVTSVSVHAGSAGSWALSNLILAKVGASLNMLG